MNEDRKIRVAVLETQYGGNATFVNDLYGRMDRSRIDVRFIYLRGGRDRDNHLERQGFPVHCLAEKGGLSNLLPVRLFRLIRLLKEHRIDLLHCHTHKPTIYGAMAGRFLPRLKVISQVHGLRRSDRFQRKLMNFLFAGRVDRFLAVAGAVRDDLLASNWRIPPSRVRILENSIDYERFASVESSPAEIRRMLSLPEDAFVFGAVGRLAPTKGLPWLLEAFAAVHKRFPRARLLLVGEGPDEAQYRRRARELGVEGAVCFAGFRRDVERILRAMDVFVISSVAEGMPRVVMEAMAAGLPCIATRVGGIPEMLDDTVGALVEPKNSQALADAMSGMLNRTGAQWNHLKTNAARRARERYHHEVAARRLDEEYRELLQL